MSLAIAIVAHPDDESYAFAGTLAWLHEHGWQCRVICLTRGEAGLDHRPERLTDLATARTGELEASCRAVGADALALHLPDGGVALHPYDLSELIRDAHVVLTHGADGAYGHPDHLACMRQVAAAQSSATVLHAAFPLGLFAAVHRAIGRFVDLEVSRADLGIAREQVDHIVDVRPYRAQKLASIAAHASQIRGGDPHDFLRPGLIAPLLEEEWLTHAAGPPAPAPFAAESGSSTPKDAANNPAAR